MSASEKLYKTIYEFLGSKDSPDIPYSMAMKLREIASEVKHKTPKETADDRASQA
jgi:hypothetical protein